MQILATIVSIALLFEQGLAAPEPQTPAGYGYGKKSSCPAGEYTLPLCGCRFD